jgi:multicomponent Na+:H+ antiporter subunit G
VSAADWATAVLAAAGVFFFLAGSIGLLRLPDVFARLHALTKADNLGLGCVLAAAAFQAGDLATVLRLALLWVLVLGASTVSCFLIAGAARRAGLGRDDAG